MPAPEEGARSLQDVVGDTRNAGRRVEEYELKQERFRYEEQEDVIREQIAEGLITEEDAQKRMARGKMHHKIEEEGSAMVLDESAAAGANYMTTQQIIEDVLDTEDKVYVVRWFKNVTGYSWIMKKANLERTKRRKPDYPHKYPKIEILVHGRPMRMDPAKGRTPPDEGTRFELVLGLFLLVNGALIGIQTSVSEEGENIVVFVMEHIFTIVFTLELIVRLLADGWIWLTEGMNFFDFLLIVLTGILPMWVLGPLGIKSNEMRMVQILRVLRLVKLVRMVRTVPMFRIFWKLIRGLLDSGRTLMWTYCMISAVLFIFAIFGVHLIGKSEAYEGDPDAQAVADEFFGDVPKTFVTLFQVMTLDSWTGISRPLMKHSDIVAPYFIVYILVVVLALGNLVTSVIINNAVESGAKDNELKAREQKDEKMKEIEELRELFLEIDEDGSGQLSKDEYDKAFDTNEKVKQKFEILGFSSKEERDEVFDLLDTGSGEIGVEQFAMGLRDMQGDAKAKDSFTICKKVTHINNWLGNLSVRLKRQQEAADELRDDIAEAHRQMGGMMIELRDVMKFLVLCMPEDEVKVGKGKFLTKFDQLLVKRKEKLSNTGTVPKDNNSAMRPQSKAPHNPNAPKKHVGFQAEMVESISPTNKGRPAGGTML